MPQCSFQLPECASVQGSEAVDQGVRLLQVMTAWALACGTAMYGVVEETGAREAKDVSCHFQGMQKIRSDPT